MKLSTAQRALLAEIVRDGRVSWRTLFHNGYRRSQTAGALSARDCIEAFNTQWDGSDYEWWQATDAGRAALEAGGGIPYLEGFKPCGPQCRYPHKCASLGCAEER